MITKRDNKSTVFVPEAKMNIQLEQIKVTEREIKIDKPVFINKEFDLKEEILKVLKPAIEDAIAEIISNSVIEMPVIKPTFGKVSKSK